MDSDALKASDGAEATLGLWNRESSHNYENNARIHEVCCVSQSSDALLAKCDQGNPCRISFAREPPSFCWSLTVGAALKEGTCESGCHGNSSSSSRVFSLLSRYDYLQFTDVLGQKKQFDDRVGSDRWPKVSKELSSPEQCLTLWPLPLDGRVPWTQVTLLLPLRWKHQ